MALCAIPVDESSSSSSSPSSLGLANNFVSVVPSCLRHMTGLRSLDLSHNMLASLPTAVDTESNPTAGGGGCGWLPASLTELSLAHNAIRGLPDRLSALTDLRTLRLADNRLANHLTGTHYLNYNL
jgi:Leucine-rich repeat (LRR) protein